MALYQGIFDTELDSGLFAAMTKGIAANLSSNDMSEYHTTGCGFLDVGCVSNFFSARLANDILVTSPRCHKFYDSEPKNRVYQPLFDQTSRVLASYTTNPVLKKTTEGCADVKCFRPKPSVLRSLVKQMDRRSAPAVFSGSAELSSAGIASWLCRTLPPVELCRCCGSSIAAIPYDGRAKPQSGNVNISMFDPKDISGVGAFVADNDIKRAIIGPEFFNFGLGYTADEVIALKRVISSYCHLVTMVVPVSDILNFKNKHVNRKYIAAFGGLSDIIDDNDYDGVGDGSFHYFNRLVVNMFSPFVHPSIITTTADGYMIINYTLASTTAMSGRHQLDSYSYNKEKHYHPRSVKLSFSGDVGTHG